MNWYESNAPGDESLRPRGWAGQHWSPAIGAEHLATREARGPLRRELVREDGDRRAGRGRTCSSTCATTAWPATSGKITYTQMLNRRGGIECDFTVARLGEERFSIVTGTAFGNHDREWIRRHLPDDGSVQVQDVTAALSCFGVWGPRARDVLQPLTPQDLGNEAFPYMTVRETTVADVPVRALRVTYVGELGWELYCPTEYGLAPVARALGGRTSRTAWWRAATGRSTRCGSRRATGSGAPTSPQTRPPTRAAWASA